MALADILLDIEYVPFILYTSFPHLISLDNSWEKKSWGWAVYMIFHAHFSVIIHNVSIWLTLSVAIWRFIMIRFHHLVPVYCTIRRCHILLFSAYGKFDTVGIEKFYSFLRVSNNLIWQLEHVTFNIYF